MFCIITENNRNKKLHLFADSKQSFNLLKKIYDNYVCFYEWEVYAPNDSINITDTICEVLDLCSYSSNKYIRKVHNQWLVSLVNTVGTKQHGHIGTYFARVPVSCRTRAVDVRIRGLIQRCCIEHGWVCYDL